MLDYSKERDKERNINVPPMAFKEERISGDLQGILKERGGTSSKEKDKRNGPMVAQHMAFRGE